MCWNHSSFSGNQKSGIAYPAGFLRFFYFFIDLRKWFSGRADFKIPDSLEHFFFIHCDRKNFIIGEQAETATGGIGIDMSKRYFFASSKRLPCEPVLVIEKELSA